MLLWGLQSQNWDLPEVTLCYLCLGQTEQLPHRTALLQDYGGTHTSECPMILQRLSHQHVCLWEWTCVPCWEQQVFTWSWSTCFSSSRVAQGGEFPGAAQKRVCPAFPHMACEGFASKCQWVSEQLEQLQPSGISYKGVFKIYSSLQNINTILLILILNIQFTDCYLITHISTPLESWFWVNNLTWTVFPLNKVYPFTICYPTGWRKRIISKLWGGLCPFQELQRVEQYFQSSVEMWLALQSQGLPKWMKNKAPPHHKELRTNTQY